MVAGHRERSTSGLPPRAHGARSTLDPMSPLLVGAFAIACGVLLVSGASKVAQPGGVAGAIGSLGLNAPRWSGRLLGVVEIGLGTAGLTRSGWVWSALVATAYVGFGIVVIALIRRGGAESCGCFGEIASPPSGVHVAFDLVAAGVASGHAAVGGWTGALTFADGLGNRAIPFFGLVVVGVACSVGILTVLPGVVAQARSAAADADARHERLHHLDDGAVQIEGAADRP